MKKNLVGIMFAIFISLLLVYMVAAAENKTAKGPGSGSEATVPKEMNETNVMEVIKKDFPNFKVSEVRKSPVAGLWELEAGSNIILFDPQAELLIFGEVLNKEGKNLTVERRNAIAEKKLAQIPLDKAVKIGNGKKSVVLFTDPDCPYCRKISEYFKKTNDITQYVFFYPLTAIHPNSETKAKYILSQKDPGKAYYEVMSGALDKTDKEKMKSDEKAASRLVEHMTLANRVGVNGTPVMWINGKYVAGVNMPLIEKFLK